mmetsp:Transcript_101527/g.327288  ORF Transcript_101527/g.327288 Transcript_101527/m.327288 type:complete len:552 (+) Transcript_101527:112-1767(+)
MAPKSAKAKAKAPAAKEKAEEEGAGNGKRAPSAGSSERPAAKKRAKAKPKPTAEEAAEESAVQGSVPKPRAATRGPQGGKRKQPAVPSPPPPGGGLHRFFSALPKAGAAVSGSSADPPPDPSLDPPASGEVAAPAAGPGGSDEGAESAPAELEGDPVVGPAASPPPSPCAALSQHGGAAAASTHEPVPAAGTADTEPRAEGAEADTETRVAGPEAATSQEAPASSPRRPLRAAAAGASAPSSQEALMSSPRPSRAREAPEPEPDDVQVLDFGSLRRADWLQYNSMYTARLAQLRSSVVQHAQSLWSGAVSPAAFKPSLVGYRGSARERGAVLVGVICKEMKLRPSTVEQYRSGLRALDFLDAAAAAAERGAQELGNQLQMKRGLLHCELLCGRLQIAIHLWPPLLVEDPMADAGARTGPIHNQLPVEAPICLWVSLVHVGDDRFQNVSNPKFVRELSESPLPCNWQWPSGVAVNFGGLQGRAIKAGFATHVQAISVREVRQLLGGLTIIHGGRCRMEVAHRPIERHLPIILHQSAQLCCEAVGSHSSHLCL